MPWQPNTIVRPKIGTKQIQLGKYFLGCGYFEQIEGGYAVGTNIDTRWGALTPGLPEGTVTTIASGFRTVAVTMHNDLMTIATTDGTDTKIYRWESSAWVLKRTISTRVATDIISYNNVLAVAFGPSNPYQYSIETGTGAYGAFTASTQAGSALYANRFLLQSNGLIAPRVLYVVNPSMLFYTADLTNAGTPVTWSTVGDPVTANDYFTSLFEDDTGFILIGKRRCLWTIYADGVTSRLTRDYADPPADAGGQSDRYNFESPTMDRAGRVYYPIEGYGLMEYHHGNINEYMSPAAISGRGKIPRLDLPINALCFAEGWLYLAIGSKNTATLKKVAWAPGGSNLLQNSFATTSEIYAGRYEQTPNGEQFVWHGSLMTSTYALRFMWYDEDDGRLVMASGDGAQQAITNLYADSPLVHFGSGIFSYSTLNGASALETGRITAGDDTITKRNKHLRLTMSTDSASGSATVAVKYRNESGRNTSAAYKTLTTWTLLQTEKAALGMAFPSNRTFNEEWLQFVLVGQLNYVPVVYEATLTVGDAA